MNKFEISTLMIYLFVLVSGFNALMLNDVRIFLSTLIFGIFLYAVIRVYTSLYFANKKITQSKNS